MRKFFRCPKTFLPGEKRTRVNKLRKELIISKEKTPNFTPEQEARIRESAPHNLASATELANEFGKTPRSVIAKIVRMDVGYQSKVRTTKSGDPVISKEKLVGQIANVVEGNLEGLEKAPKAALQALARFVASGE